MTKIRTRIAPSPTGDPHVGTAYMALWNYIFAKHHGGDFLLRIEDTDQTRSRKHYEDEIFKTLHWAGIQWDEGPDIGGPCGPYRQSERLELYQKHANELLKQDKAYKCFCTSEELETRKKIAASRGGRQGYDRRCRNLSEEEIAEFESKNTPYTIRMKAPLTGECVYEDQIKGRITVPWADVDDQVLLKSDGFPTYHLANIVDDHEMKITHIIRGDEWMSSTPKHVFLYEASGWTPPIYMHMPLLLGTDGKKLSKRKNPTSIGFYRDSGYLPEAFVNFLTLMGYSMPDDQEIYSLDQLIKEFDPKRIGVSGAVFDVQKLDWINQQYLINTIPEDQLWNRIKEWKFQDKQMQSLMPMIQTRIKTFGDFMDLCDFFFVNHLRYTPELFAVKKLEPQDAAIILQGIIRYMEDKEEWSSQSFNEGSRHVAELFGVNHKKVVMKLLFASLMGKHQGPPLFDSVDLLGRHRVRARLIQAIQFLGGVSTKRLQQFEKAWKNQDCKALVEKE